MLLFSLLLTPLLAIFVISSTISYGYQGVETATTTGLYQGRLPSKFCGVASLGAAVNKKKRDLDLLKLRFCKITALIASGFNLILSLIIFILFDFSSNQYQFVQEYYDLNFFEVYLGIDGISIYFVLLTTIIMPIAILSN